MKQKTFKTAKITDKGIEVVDVGLKLKPNQKYLGNVAVDSGGILIVDPCYLHDWRDGEYGDDNHYTKAGVARDGVNMGGEIIVTGIAGTGVSLSSGYGDGCYPVVATYEDGRIKKVEVIFF
jgi:hypothetical protein